MLLLLSHPLLPVLHSLLLLLFLLSMITAEDLFLLPVRPSLMILPVAVRLSTHILIRIFLNDPTTTQIYTLSLHDALPILLLSHPLLPVLHSLLLLLFL